MVAERELFNVMTAPMCFDPKIAGSTELTEAERELRNMMKKYFPLPQIHYF
jgi:hypothetical protein